MNLNSFFASFLTFEIHPLSLEGLLLTLFLPFLLSLLMAAVYKHTQSNNNYSVAFLHSIVLFSMLSAVSTLVVGSNIARAFGLIGALSIIRFRNALKSPLDAIYIFWALIVGMTCGAGFYFAAIIMVMACSAAALALHIFKVGENKDIESILRVGIKLDHEQEVLGKIESILKSFTKKYNLVNTLFNVEQNEKTLVYMIKTNLDSQVVNLHKQIKVIDGIWKVNQLNSEPFLFFE